MRLTFLDGLLKNLKGEIPPQMRQNSYLKPMPTAVSGRSVGNRIPWSRWKNGSDGFAKLAVAASDFSPTKTKIYEQHNLDKNNAGRNSHCRSGDWLHGQGRRV